MSDVKPVAWMYPSDLATFEGSETFANAWSLEVTNIDTGEDTAPLYSKESIAVLQAEIVALRKDAERLDWVQRNLLSADFEYEYQPGKTRPVLIIAWPRDVAIGGNARMNFDAAIAKEKQQESLK